MAQAVRLLNGEQLTTRNLKALAKQHWEIPTSTLVANLIAEHPGESWAQWVAEAEQLARDLSAVRALETKSAP